MHSTPHPPDLSSSDMACDTEGRIAHLWLYPVKSCAPVAVTAAVLTDTGLDLDRAWMVVDAGGDFVSQRELPRMALIRPTLRSSDLVLRAPGMLALHLSLDAVEGPTHVRIWDDRLPAWDMGSLAAQWFSDFLGRPLRLVRFDPDQQRRIAHRWTDGHEAGAQFADGFPLLVLTEAAVAQLGERLAQRGGLVPVDARRLRPNLVLADLPAHEEDHLEQLEIDTGAGRVRLLLTKPCERCTVPDVDPDSGRIDGAVGAQLRAYRRDPRVQGAVTFGMNAIVLEGVGQTLRTGQVVRGRIRWGG